MKPAFARKTFRALCGMTISLFFLWSMTCTAQVKNYATNSLIIPMDTSYQARGMFRAYGLVYKLLASGVPVDWAIKPGKAYQQADFTNSFRNIQTSVTGTHNYAGGPFVIDAANRAAALPIIQAWQTINPNVIVHEATAPFTTEVGRSLVAAPRLAVFADGNQSIAFGYLNAAAIPDSQGQGWSTTTNSVDLLTPESIAGITQTNHHDGALFDSNGVPRFSALVSAHYNKTSPNLEAIAETGEFLKQRTLLFAECQSAVTFENNGHFLTDQGLTIKAQPNSGFMSFPFPDQPIAQDDGPFGTVGGSEPSYVPTGSYLGSEGVNYFRILRGTVSSTNVDVAILGYAYQNTNAGRVFYLGGHQYGTALPISANPSSDGVRYFLNALLFAPSTAANDGLANLVTALSGPASPTTNRTPDFSLSYQNTGAGAALDAQAIIPLPPGATASMISGSGTNSGGWIIWNLGNLATNAAGVLSFRLTLSTNGIYPINSSFIYKRGITSVTNINNLTVTNTVALTARHLPASKVEVSFKGDTNRNYDLQLSSNLVNWVFLTTLNSTNGYCSFIDSTTNLSSRFYRVQIP